MSRLVNALIAPRTGDVEPTPLHFVTEADLEALAKPMRARALLEGFEAKPHSFLLDIDAECRLARVYVGVEKSESAARGFDRFTLAGVAEKLPKGRYCFAEPLVFGEDLPLVAHGWAIGQYQFDRYKQDPSAPLRQLVIDDADALTAARETVAAVELTRDLINTPAGDLGPAELEQAAETLASDYEAPVRMIRGDKLLEAGFPAIHAVGRAAGPGMEPRLIEINWSGSEAGDDAPKITLVGKGVCFDSGGLNIKTGDFMSVMKKDMGGAAHVLGLTSLIMERDLPLHLHVLIPAVENAISGNAFRPGDILDTRAGITVEVGNTDAEGRVILADALAYAVEQEPDWLIDFATLTGAARIALGADLPPVYTDDDDLFDRLQTGAADMADPLWRMPLYAPYDAMIEGTVADITNSGASRFAGSITAALFLRRFVAETTWAHLDVYAWSQNDRPGRRKGGIDQGLLAVYNAIETMTLDN